MLFPITLRGGELETGSSPGEDRVEGDLDVCVRVCACLCVSDSRVCPMYVA